MRDLEREIREFITENYPLAVGASGLDGDASLTRSGIVDSVGVLELIQFLETNFGIRIPDEEVVLENLDTVDRIVRYVEAKLGSRKEEGHGGYVESIA